MKKFIICKNYYINKKWKIYKLTSNNRYDTHFGCINARFFSCVNDRGRKLMIRKLVTIIVMVVMVIVILPFTSCFMENTENIGEIRIGLLPDDSNKELIDKYSPLAKYISKNLGIKYKFIIADSYHDLLDKFHQRKVDLARMGGFTFIKAHLNDGAIPIFMREIDANSTSMFITHNKNHDDKKNNTPSRLEKKSYILKEKSTGQFKKELQRFKGQTFSFGPILSTSGHLMPRYFMKELKIQPESFFGKITYSNRHNQTALLVQDGKIDLAVVHSQIIRDMFQNNQLDPKKVKIIWETPSFFDNVWAIHPDIPTSLKEKIEKSFIKLSGYNKNQSSINPNKTPTGLGSKNYVMAKFSDFEKLVSIINEFDLDSIIKQNNINHQKTHLILGIHPFLSIIEIYKRFTPLANYLSKKTGYIISLKVPGNYQEHINMVGKDKRDFAYMGPAPYLIMKKQFGKKRMLAQVEINGKPYFQGKIIVPQISNIKSLKELEGKRFAFGDQNSTLSHLVPRALLLEAGIDVSKFSHYSFLGSHSNVALSVLVGDYDAGGVKESVFYKYKNRGLKALSSSPLIAEHVFVASNKLPKHIFKKLKSALLNIKNEPDGIEAMKSIKKTVSNLVEVELGGFENLQNLLEPLRKAGVRW